MKKAIFGGTFDPIHIGHMYIAEEAVRTLQLDKVIFMPSGNPPHKTEKIITDAALRYEMVEEAIRDFSSFEVCDYEIKKEALSYTFETLEYFKELECDTQWYFITGCDCLFDLDYWKNVDRILKCAKLVVFNRPGFDKEDIFKQKKIQEDKYGYEIIFLDLLLIDISSTYIRTGISQGRELSFFMPSGVNEIIKREKLYK